MDRTNLFFIFLENWKVLLPQTKLAGPFINYGTPRSATIALKLSGKNEWIIGIQDSYFLKMVKLRVTGANTYKWISTKYRRDGTYDASCLTSFSESCYRGTNENENFYQVLLVAKRGKQEKINFVLKLHKLNSIWSFGIYV